MSKISKFLSKEEKERFGFQVLVNKDLYEKVAVKKRKSKLKWQELVEAMFKAYLEEP